MNGRLSSLILACDAFEAHPRSASVEQLVVTVLNQRVPGLSVTTADLQAAHKFQNDSKVFCKFTKRQVRDAVYESRFDMVRFCEGNTGRDGRQLAPLYISESLTPRNRLLYDELLRAKRPESGGLIASVFSRRGVVWCRTERGGANLRVRDEADLRRILGGRRFPVQQRVSGRGALPRTSPAARRPPDSDSFDGRPPPRRATGVPRAAGRNRRHRPPGSRAGRSGRAPRRGGPWYGRTPRRSRACRDTDHRPEQGPCPHRFRWSPR